MHVVLYDDKNDFLVDSNNVILNDQREMDFRGNKITSSVIL